MAVQRLERTHSQRPVVRTPDPPLARPGEFARAAWRDIRRSGPLAVEMSKRDIRAQYRLSILGIFVALLPTVAMTAIGVGFQRAGILATESGAVPYGLFVVAGVVLWTTFIEALSAPIYGLLAEQRLLARTSSPLEAIVLGKLGQVFFNLGLKLLLVGGAVIWYRSAVPATLLLVPVGLVALVAFGTAIGLILAPVNIVYRDVSKILVTVTTFWFFLSPVYFPPPATGIIGAIMRVNPVTPLLSGTRALAIGGDIPDPMHGALTVLVTFTLLVLCWVYVRVTLPIAIEQGNEG